MTTTSIPTCGACGKPVTVGQHPGCYTTNRTPEQWAAEQAAISQAAHEAAIRAAHPEAAAKVAARRAAKQKDAAK